MNKGPFRKFHIHPVFWVVLGAGILTGHFWQVFTVFFIVLVHEFGHAIAAKSFGWRISSIELLPFGGVAKVDEFANRPFKEEWIVTLAGPVQHLWLPAFSYLLTLTPYWNEANHAMFLQHNWMILFFNLLPVWPLDGGKLLLLCFAKFLPYKRAYRYTLLGSLCVLFTLSLGIFMQTPFSLNFLVIAVFLITAIHKEWKQQRYVLLRFLLGKLSVRDQEWKHKKIRTLFVTPDMPLIQVLERFYKDTEHRIVIRMPGQRPLLKEQQLLDAFFNKQYYHQSVSDFVP